MQVRSKRARNAYRTGKRLPKGPNGGIQLMLIHTIPSLGKQGEIVEVKPGYAKNYLIPQGLATIATDECRAQLEAYKQEMAEKEKALVSDLTAVAEKIKQTPIQITAKAHEEVNPENPDAKVYYLYGSIGAKEIVAALQEKGIEIAPENVKLAGSIKEANATYEIEINLGHDVKTTLTLSVLNANS